MSLLYLTLFIPYTKGPIIPRNKLFLLTEFPLLSPLSLHTFFHLISQFKCRVVQKFAYIFRLYNPDTTTQLDTAKSLPV
jgi:hypothetical protein